MRSISGVSAFVGTVVLASCADRGQDTPARIVARSSVVASVIPSGSSAASVEERFGLPEKAPKADAGVSEAAAMLLWDLPAGWIERAASAMRVANFAVAGSDEAECYLTILAGDGGGVGANVNRWLAQMQRPALVAAQIDELPRSKLFHRDAVLLDVEGTFTGMSGGSAQAGRRLLGLLLVDPNGSAFLKFVGPADVVEREKNAFFSLAESFRSASDRRSEEVSSATRIERAAGLVARVPESWMRVPEKPPRALDLRVDADVECSITVLAGPAGGARANIDRWRGQIGLPPLDDAQYAGLEVVSMLGRSALLVEATSGNSGVLGAVVESADRSVFVKLTGPMGQIGRQRAAFLELCRTLEND